MLLCIFCFLIKLLFPKSGGLVVSRSLFLIGDSVDRCIVEDWCHLKGDLPHCDGPHCIYWLPNDSGISRFTSGANKVAYQSDMMCIMESDSIAFIHHYGSRPIGPYLHNINSINGGEYVDSSKRIIRSLEMYVSTHGFPDQVMYHSAQWDIQLIYEEYNSRNSLAHGNLDIRYSILWNETVAVFENNLNSRIDDIQTTLERLNSSHTMIGLRTAVWNDVGGELLHEFNNIIHRTSSKRGLTFFDFDKDVWSTVDWNYQKQSEVLRDWIHPISYYTSLAGQKMIGNRFTNYIKFRGDYSSLDKLPKIWLGDYNLLSTQILEIKLIHEDNRKNFFDSRDHQFDEYLNDNNTYYLDTNITIKSVQRYGPISTEMRLSLRLGMGDIFLISRHKLNTIPLKNINFENFYNQRLLIKINNKFFILENKIIREVLDSSVLYYYGFIEADAIQDVDASLLSVFTTFGSAIPDIYKEDTLIRYVNSREVFVVMNKTRRSIYGTDVFYAHGWDFSQVHIVNIESDMLLIPAGEPLTQ